MSIDSTCNVNRVAIIGGGTAGLAAYRHVTAYSNMGATIFERLTSLGGMWSKDFPHHRSDMSTNVSRHSCSFSDFPWPKEEIEKQGKEPFPNADDVGRYLQLYAESYIRPEDVRLCTNVESTQFEHQQWVIATSDASDPSNHKEEHFDYVIFASGFFSTPYTPPIPGLAQSQIHVIHSADFSGSEDYRNKEVVVIGGSLSAVEIAGILCSHAARVHHVYSLPFYPIQRYVPNAEPLGAGRLTFTPVDLVFNKRSTRKSMKEQTQPTTEMNRKKHEYLSSLCPSLPYPPHPDDPPRVGISDTYVSGLRSGVIVPHLARFDSVDEATSNIYLSSGEEIPTVDAIILGTGYTTAFPYLSSDDKATIEYDGDNLMVPFLSHRLVLHPDLPQAGFAGLYRGPYFAVIELQARYLAALFAGEKPWPIEADMRAGVEQERQIRESVRDRKRQFPHSDYGGLVETYARLLDLPLPTSTSSQVDAAVSDQILACNYPRERNEDVMDIEKDVLETLQMSNRGTWVLGAVFRSWCGHWKVVRVIKHDMPGGMDGSFNGIATFHLRQPSPLPSDASKLRPKNPAACSLPNGTSSPDSAKATSDAETGVLEYLYHEAGTFTTSTGVSFQAHRKYVYRYSPRTDIISVWFVMGGAFGSAPDQGDIDYWFHDIVLSSSSDGSAGLWFPEHRDDGGWTAKGDEHLCVRDVYSPIYRFCFNGNEVQQFGIGYDVRGPDKGYISEAWYARET
ncbi:FAD/NAD(P)-binding domain-containing protein [Neolentinus lepideus HHB14362 ss-1]|uniref:FAD/NAD(P)-binding domain-containing protein n=1 Tax=Neolentinus lepideus HHB14362 ss-1 TaxID=1314782 RepID=A0A165QCC5_9AGAM|nr:FAD/NAD(P)-binding domain-containing protein [Neolentinus lepideus HHB14362 ss-1]